MFKFVTRNILAAVASLGVVSLITSAAQAAEVIPSLELGVNPLNGVTRIITTGTPASGIDTNGTADLDSYTIVSPTASNVWDDVLWNSITDQDGGSWSEVPAGGSTTQLGELNLIGSKPFAFSDFVSLGSVYDITDTTENINFTYGLSGDSTALVGNVVFEGLNVVPTLELRVNRLNGLTRIVTVGSTDPADVNLPIDLDSYTMVSPTASNVWDHVVWNSITDQDGGSWTEVPAGGSATELGELNLSGSKTLSSGNIISLGNVYDIADDTENVTFTYGLDGNSTPLIGNVVFEGQIVTAAMQLRINRYTGEARLVGVGGSTDPADVNVPANLDSYTIESSTASNVWNPVPWDSLTDQDGGGWAEVPVGGSATQLGELNLIGSKAISSGDVVSLGTIYDITDTEEDITFLYGLAGDDDPIVGSVVFDGVGLRLRVNKSTGKIEIVNAETAGVDFDAYVIQSASGDLNTTAWNSLEDQAIPGWQETNSSSFDISELNLSSSSLLPSGSTFDLGAAYQGGVGGTEDLSFVYSLPDADALNGVIEYIIAGDMDGDGDVDTDDVPLFVQALVNRAAYDANGFTNQAGFLVDADIVGDVNGNDTFDLGDLGVFSALLGGPASASAVPEPASGGLLIVALGALSLVGYRRRGVAKSQGVTIRTDG